jgi:hypothetical protein
LKSFAPGGDGGGGYAIPSVYEQHSREAKDQCEGIDREKGKERNDAKKRFDVLQGEMNRMQDIFNRLDSVGKGSPLARFGNDVPKIAAAFREKEKVFPQERLPLALLVPLSKLRTPNGGLPCWMQRKV